MLTHRQRGISDSVPTHSPGRPNNRPKAQRNTSHPQPAPNQRRTLRLMRRINPRIRHANRKKHRRKPIQSIQSRFLQSSHVAQHNRCSEERQILAKSALDKVKCVRSAIGHASMPFA
jgi:hypothetical protein